MQSLKIKLRDLFTRLNMESTTLSFPTYRSRITAAAASHPVATGIVHTPLAAVIAMNVGEEVIHPFAILSSGGETTKSPGNVLSPNGETAKSQFLVYI